MSVHSQRGNAVIYILIAIALFGALAFAFMRGAKTGQGNLSISQTKTAAGEILSYAAAVGQTVDRLRQRGCSETDISFEYSGNPQNALYAHTPVAPDKCKIFHASGGKMTPPTFSSLGYLEPSVDRTWYTGEADLMYFTVTGIGSDGGGNASRDGVFFVLGVKKGICEELNKQLGFPTADITTDTYAGLSYYNGLFTAPGLATMGWGFDGRAAACFHYAGAQYNFYYVILAR